MKILDGIRVLELGVFGQAPLAASMLGDLGADVIKIEHPVTGDLVRATAKQWGSQRQIEVDGKPFHLDIDMMNRSKRGITLDVGKPKGQEIAFRLLKTCDVFISNLRRASVEDRWGFTYERMKQVNPRIIRLLTNGVGRDGPEAGLPAFDPVGMARSGFMLAASPPGTEPRYPIGAFADMQAAEINVIAVLAALLARERHGFGQDIATSQFGSMLWFQQLNVYTTLVTGKQYVKLPRYETNTPINLEYRCGDGKWIFIGGAQPQYWEPFCGAVGRPDLISDPRFLTPSLRADNARDLILLLEALFLTKARDHWIDALSRADVVHAPINEMQEAVLDEQARINGYIVDVDHPVLGQIKGNGFPIQFSETPFELKRVAPQKGQHTDEVLREIGYSEDEIKALRVDGII
ncbi:CoA transferase [Alsobacter sp. SYSU M60028]|uniref:CoA transferase n=1 Tax=Alsobacter ponti TaxID=2962936 RepID=A0ABT1L8C5_9HYPH|nr:CoA transferase [Alsobacter ponti]MCP8937757.1 CoA transferase [Alsobacter ponti]